MTYRQAQDILDLRRAGRDMPPSVIDKALEMTGDLEIPVDAVTEAIAEMVSP